MRSPTYANRKIQLTANLLTLCSLVVSTPVFAEQGNIGSQKAYLIARQIDLYNKGYIDYETDIVMRLYGRHGELVVEKSLVQKTLEVESKDIVRRSILAFNEPKVDRGVALLSVIHRESENEQYLYLPSLKRTKRIVSRSRSGSFAASEVSYEDLDPDPLDAYTYAYVRQEKVDGVEVEVIERFPQSRHSGYARQRIWYDMAKHQAIQIESFDRKDALLKQHEFSNFKMYLDKYYRPLEISVANVQTGRRTELLFFDYNHRVGFTPDQFRQTALEDVRFN